MVWPSSPGPTQTGIAKALQAQAGFIAIFNDQLFEALAKERFEHLGIAQVHPLRQYASTSAPRRRTSMFSWTLPLAQPSVRRLRGGLSLRVRWLAAGRRSKGVGVHGEESATATIAQGLPTAGALTVAMEWPAVGD